MEGDNLCVPAYPLHTHTDEEATQDNVLIKMILDK